MCRPGETPVSSRAGEPMTAIPTSDGYRLWAPFYSDETAISYLEQRLVSSMTPPLAGLRLLDAGCGTGRRARSSGAATIVALDASAEMIAAGVAGDGPFSDVLTVVGDVRAMPLESRSFDVIWCRLVVGHLPRLDEVYGELGRLADAGALVIVSDFHPAACDAGHRRAFRIGTRVIELEHHVHRMDAHVEAARRARLELVESRAGVIGNDVRPFYEQAGRSDAFAGHVGLPVVLALSFRREC